MRQELIATATLPLYGIMPFLPGFATLHASRTILGQIPVPTYSLLLPGPVYTALRSLLSSHQNLCATVERATLG